ncbi:carboxynorspermidine decarboxylase [Sphingobium wenxiniae]|uniref:Carboxynorspermidine/carboxyspermidine decarboxylase n=2 Tax=Sphingobium TaxID=165695 RepID=T0GBF1_9SPHN|nr:MULTISPECIES: carboxynorspermidine decarboxylase [Sphingobium]EQA97981.1 carboxynorspermidine decarboxylase [Sphingobium baderi LL03]KMS63509.1 carboxynorspermidine decarboxylase [Sphingobium baderi LL03]MBB6190124.1 carboxynorspermidine decarboxylase [Sphingobium wenxiniae]TWH97561.1 carboxynorspermidine decarboxylase [Sphingobium wenxiniae]WRD77394.1 carboxynorspermidine decarboxylase [Sphingobium baderi]
METRAGDPAAFAQFDLHRVPSPAFVVDEAAIRRNLAILADIGERAGIKVLGALKAFSMWSLGGVVAEYLDGVCASGIYEARLGREEYGGEVATYCAAYKAQDLPEILRLSDHVIFNSPGQIARLRPIIEAARAEGHAFDIGLRINPLHAEGEVPKYDPCQPHSRLGFPIDQLRAEHLEGVSGLHFHSLCEQDFLPLERTWAAIESRVLPHAGRLEWLNFGGGHHVTRADYQREELIAFLRGVREKTGLQLYIEPGEAMALDAGILVGEILDVIDNGMEVAITDISATCHMPDVIEAPYRPAMLHEEPEGQPARLGGPSCLAGDIIGDYRVPGGATPGRRIAFLDQAHYSMVKTNTFNGVPLPSIWLWNSMTDELKEIRQFSYADFKGRLS